jgi:hypothetical protein
MALLSACETDEYWTEYGVLVIRDRGGDPDEESMGLLAEHATESQPGGTIAIAGAGWLWGRATDMDGENEVRLEAHDSAPPDAAGAVAGWDDVVETPYLSFSGTVGLSILTGGDNDDDTLQLGPAGQYRVRVCRRTRPPAPDPRDAAGDDAADFVAGDTWLLQFWPATGSPQPPRWLVRAPVVIDESPGWDYGSTLDPHVSSVLRSALELSVRHPEGVSAAQITADRAAIESAFADQADPASPLWPPAPRPYLTTGHADLDAFEAQVHAKAVAEWEQRQSEVAALAAQFGVPNPVTLKDVLPLLVGMGLLSVREDGDEPRYQPPTPSGGTWRLAGPPEASGENEAEQIYFPVADGAADLVCVALWSSPGQAGTVADLAERLLVSIDDLRATLRYAQQEQLLRVEGDPDDAASRLTLTPLPRSEEPAGEPRSVPLPVEGPGVVALIQVDSQARSSNSGDSPRLSARLVVTSSSFRTGATALPVGAPPRAGIITRSAELIVWRDGHAEVLASVPEDAFRAIETRYGVVVLSPGASVLVREGGQAEVLATDTGYSGHVSADGRYLAFEQNTFGRARNFALHLIDIADGSRQTLPWPTNVGVFGVYGGAVFFGAADADCVRWTPGTDPEPLPWKPRTIDRLSGRMLVDGFDHDIDGWLVIGQDGERYNVLASGAAELALGGTQMIYLRYDPPAVTLFDVATGGANPRVVSLPERSDTSTHTWEEPGHLLFSRPYSREAARAVRLDVRTGEVEGVPFPGAEREMLATFVESLADPG